MVVVHGTENPEAVDRSHSDPPPSVNISSIFWYNSSTMRATKKRADILYKVLLKHFDVDQFMVEWSPRSHKMYLDVFKNSRVRPLYVYANHRRIELAWATNYLCRSCLDWRDKLLDMAVGIEYFYSCLKEVSWAFKMDAKNLTDIKHEIVKQVLSALRKHYIIEIAEAGNIATWDDYAQHIYKIDNLEQLVVQEELNIDINGQACTFQTTA